MGHHPNQNTKTSSNVPKKASGSLTISQHGTKLASCSHKGKLGGTHIQTQSYDVNPSRNHTKIHQTWTSAGFNWHLYILVIQRLNLQKSRFLDKFLQRRPTWVDPRFLCEHLWSVVYISFQIIICRELYSLSIANMSHCIDVRRHMIDVFSCIWFWVWQ